MKSEQDMKEIMAKEMMNTYEFIPNSHNIVSPVVQSRPMLWGQTSNASAMPMGTSSLDDAIEHEIRMGTLDPNLDKKTMRRIISNRYAAKKSQLKRVNKMTELEKNRKYLEETIAALQNQMEHERELQSRLRIENEMLALQLQIRTNLESVKEAQIYEKTMEIQWLKELRNIQLQEQGGT